MSARNLSQRQFFKANPNQMALPGMEDVSPNPMAHLLTKGYTVEHMMNSTSGMHTLALHHPEAKTEYVTGFPGDVAALTWAGSAKEMPRHMAYHYRGGYSPGEIAMVQSHTQGQGHATALYGVGRKLTRVKPRHSVERTHEGDRWAKIATEIHGGRVPKKNTL